MWEYMVTEVMGNLYMRYGNVQGTLNDIGAEGWELVTVITQGTVHMAYFKRPVKVDGYEPPSE
jgi:hypothetical protein